MATNRIDVPELYHHRRPIVAGKYDCRSGGVSDILGVHGSPRTAHRPGLADARYYPRSRGAQTGACGRPILPMHAQKTERSLHMTDKVLIFGKDT